MNCFIQHYSPHSRLITKNCSSVSHFHICGQSCSLQCIFTAHIYYFCTIPLRSDMAHPSRKSPTLTLWKSLQIELSQQFPASLSWQNVFIAVQGSSVPMNLCVIHQFDRRECAGAHAYAHQHTCTDTLSGEKQGANYGLLWQTTAVGKPVSPQAGHSAPDILPAWPLTVIGTLWYLGIGNKGTMETLKLGWRICWFSADTIIRSYWTVLHCAHSPTHCLYWNKN